MNDKLKQAIGILKDYRRGDFVGDDEFIEAIDTVVAYCEEKQSAKSDFLKSAKEPNPITHPYDLSKK